MDSKALIGKQFRAHAETLCELLSSPGREAAPAPIVERSLVGTRMLAGSASVMGIGLWPELCTAYESLLRRYHDGGLAWDERIADVTSELIEKVEAVVALHEGDAEADLGAAIPADEMKALIAELGVLEEECKSMPVVERPAPARPEVIDSNEPGDPGPLPGIVAELRASFHRLHERLDTKAWEARDWASNDMEAIRRELNTIDFCARSIEKVIGDNANGSYTFPRCSLTPLRVALGDFAAELCRGTGRTLDVALVGEEQTIDARLLSTTALVLQSMITDTFSRADATAVHIEASAVEAHGAIRWRLRDDGDNFISDSPLDSDDSLAFYPGLRNVINLIGRHRGVLWVESGEGPHYRFEFTLPVSEAHDAVLTWGEGSEAFAVRASQVCSVTAGNDAGVGQDEYGSFIAIDGKRVPLFDLDGLYTGAPQPGSAIVVVGSLEKRIAFRVPGAGERANAHVFNGAVPAWEGAPPSVAQIDQRRVQLLDADHVMAAYHSITGTMGTDSVSGGVPEDGPEFAPRQATPTVGVPAPPAPAETTHGEKGIDVLVVEQSESMQEALTAILTKGDVSAACVSEIEEALSLIEARKPRLIISEFRMPTMAAKRLVDELDGAGVSIPVLVTTSQTGKTAELLVEKLGACGYLSKPLDPAEVASLVAAHLGHEVIP